MSREQVISETFAALDKLRRKASVAQIGGFRPTDLEPTSWFGGKFSGRADETWPVSNGRPMLPLLQVRCDELPHRPDTLKDLALFNVFIDAKALPLRTPAANGQGWLIRTYTTVDGLRYYKDEPSAQATGLKHFQIRWIPREDDGPTWDGAWEMRPDEIRAFSKLPDAIQLHSDRYPNEYGTKVGGWPTYVQGAIDLPGRFVFQIASEEKPGWMWGDRGCAYFYLRDGRWLMHWDCL
jgi:hypothetical protein